jgi:calcium-dependent protein kinase
MSANNEKKEENKSFVEEKVHLNDDWLSIKKDLEKIWMPVTEREQFEYNTKKQIENCRMGKSRWVYRQTPHLEVFFKVGKVLGNPGQYGVVREAVGIRGKFMRQKVAVKTVSKLKYRTEKVLRVFFHDLRTEVRLMRSSSSFKHPNIIQVFAVFEDIKNLHIVMEHCSGGELFDRLSKDGVGSKDFDEERASKVCRQLLEAVHHLHKLGIAHCDLKPENFIFDSAKKDATIKLIDFGMAKIVRWREYSKRMNGTPYYIAPEVLRGKYNEACDMWSIGVIIFIIVLGFPPFFDATNNPNRKKSDKIIYERVKAGFTPKVMAGWGAWFPASQPISRECKDLIARLLRDTIGDRLNSEEALDHPWISGKAAFGKLTAPQIDPTIQKSVKFFKRNCQLQSEILNVLNGCSYLSASQAEAVEAAFKEMDTDGDGMVTKEELYQSLHKIDPSITEEDCTTIMMSVDANSNGVMDFDELLSSRINRKLTSKEERMRKIFKCLDRDNSNTLTADEIKDAVVSINSSITVKRCQELIAEADTNNDGVIDYEEWLKVFL